MPVRTSSTNDVVAGGGAIVSRLRMRAISSAEATNVAASAAMAIGAVQQRDQRAAERGPGDFGDGVDRLALAVGVEQALARHEVGDEHVVGEVEEHRRRCR